MTALEKARRISELVDIMVKAFTELTDEHWYEAVSPMDFELLNKELGLAERLAFRNLRDEERLALSCEKTTKQSQ